MTPSAPAGSEAVAWVRQVNSRWIVHGGLGEQAEAYLAHLESTDPQRLISACERAARLVHTAEPTEDPKPRFYAALFSVATPDEAAQYLAGHWFTSECVPSLAGRSTLATPPERVGPETAAKIARIRKAVSELD